MNKHQLSYSLTYVKRRRGSNHRQAYLFIMKTQRTEIISFQHEIHFAKTHVNARGLTYSRHNINKRHCTHGGNCNRRQHRQNWSYLPVSTARVSFAFDTLFTWDTALKISVVTKMGHVQVTRRSVTFKSQWLLYVPLRLLFGSSTLCPKSVSQWFLCISGKKNAIISAYSIN